MNPLPIIQFDRSRVETWQSCPRKRYYAYSYEGIGLEREALSIPLLTGGQVHKGLECLLNKGSVGDAVALALAEYDSQVADRGIDEPGVVGESNRAMIEALIRGYALVSLPSLLERFEVLGVECEEEKWWEIDVPHVEHKCATDSLSILAGGGMGELPQPARLVCTKLVQKVRLLARLDALLKRKADGATFVLSFKTCSAADQWWVEGFLYDNQTVSECLAAEARLGHKVDGVIVQGLVKGARKVKHEDQWHNSSPLIWGWRNEEKGEWAARYEWTDEAGLSRCLGKGFRRAPVWREYEGGVAKWVERLANENADLLAESFVELPPVLRSQWEVDQWQRQTLAQEIRIAESAQLVNSEADSVAKLHLLDIHFPKHSAGQNCIRPSKCSMHSLCWSAAGQDPLNSGYRYRTFNHPQEKDHHVESIAKLR